MPTNSCSVAVPRLPVFHVSLELRYYGSEPMNTTLIKSSLAAALGGLLFGFDTAVIAGTTAGLTRTYHLTPGGLGVTVSIALWGTFTGAVLAGYAGDRFGRRDSLRILAAVFLASALGCGLAWSWGALAAFRLLAGLAIGGSSVLAPMYIAEIAPARLRGRLVGLFQLFIVTGILLAYFSNYVVGELGLGAAEWRWKFAVSALPALVFLVVLYTAPRSPRWLATRGQNAEAERVLSDIGYRDAPAELAEINASISAGNAARSEALFQRRHQFPIFLAVSIALFNQFSGINAILYYLNDIFARAGFSKVSGDLQSVLVGATNLVFTLLGMALIDKVGRKLLLQIGAAGTLACLLAVAAVFHSGTHAGLLLWALIAYIAFFACSQGAVIWVYIGEVFPNRVRGKGQSLGCFTHWFCAAVIALLFPSVASRWAAGPFVFFAAVTAVQFVVVWRYYPETRGVSLEALQQQLEG